MARRRKRNNELARDIAGFGIAGAGLTVGTSVVSGIGGSAAAAVGTGFVKGARMFPAFAGILIAKHVVKQTDKLQSQLQQKRKGR